MQCRVLLGRFVPRFRWNMFCNNACIAASLFENNWLMTRSNYHYWYWGKVPCLLLAHLRRLYGTTCSLSRYTRYNFQAKFTNIFWVMGQFHFSCTLALPTVINILRSKKTSIVSKWFCERLFVLRLPYWLNQDIFRNVQTSIENAVVGSLCDLFYIFWNASLHWVDRHWRSQPL